MAERSTPLGNYLFPYWWVDRNLCNWKKGKQLITRLSRTSESSGLPPTIAKDRRVTEEGQELLCIRSDAALEEDSSAILKNATLQASHPVRQGNLGDKEKPTGVRGWCDGPG